MKKVTTACGDYLVYLHPLTIVSNVFMRNGTYPLMFIGWVSNKYNNYILSKMPQKRFAEYGTKLYLMVRLHFWGSGECGILFHCHYPKTSLTHNGSTCWGPIYGSNRSVLRLLDQKKETG